MYVWNIDPDMFSGKKDDMIGSGYELHRGKDFCRGVIGDYKRALIKPEHITIVSIAVGVSVYDTFSNMFPELEKEGLFVLIGRDGKQMDRF